jgi:hypothetical protein
MVTLQVKLQTMEFQQAFVTSIEQMVDFPSCVSRDYKL